MQALGSPVPGECVCWGVDRSWEGRGTLLQHKGGTMPTVKYCPDVKSTAINYLISFHVQEARDTSFCVTQMARL